jgi:hypothetical protein
MFNPMIEKMVDIYNHPKTDNGEESDSTLAKEQINQLTLNEYEPGQGIASHIGESPLRLNVEKHSVDCYVMCRYGYLFWRCHIHIVSWSRGNYDFST